MKTGGTTFIQHLRRNFPADRSYPVADDRLARRRQYFMIDELLAHHAAHPETVAYSGHFPYVVSRLVDATITMTVLREPVARTISALRHFRLWEPRLADATLEQIYDDEWTFALYLHNHQTRMFAMDDGDKLESFMDPIAIDEHRLALALDRLDAVDVVGVCEEFPQFVRTLGDRFGWHIADVPNYRVSDDDDEVSADLRERILHDNAADVALYRRALDIVTNAGVHGG
ncbi:MAG: hypothetical protein R2695_13750 [Acidimicrobiales bacterium]